MADRVAIVGSRLFKPISRVTDYVNGLPEGTVVVSGAGGNVDCSAVDAALRRGLPTKEYPADWRLYGKAAGPMRNTDIARDCTRLVAFWDGKSRGTCDVIAKAHWAGKSVEIIYQD